MTRQILITGAGRGLGLELARQYADDGWTVFATCRDPGKASALSRLADSNHRVSVFGLDVTDIDGISKLSQLLKEEWIDVLFNNAGTGIPKVQDFGSIDEKAWIEAFTINVIGPLKMAESFIHQVARSDQKIIATMSSIMGSIAENTYGNYYVYRSTKAAVNMVMKSLASDLYDKQIISICLHPGWVRTDLGGTQAPLETEESVRGIRRVLASLTLKDSGRFLTYEGAELPW
jgi:NAD(P)-dependent dehydrogenase (short-subunit alcohol dehydrogenase family)